MGVRNIRIGCHQDQENQALAAMIGHAVFNPGGGQGDVVLAQLLFLPPDFEHPLSLEHIIDLVRLMVGMGLLSLPRLKTVKVTKEMMSIKETCLLHLVRREGHHFQHILMYHLYLTRFNSMLGQGLKIAFGVYGGHTPRTGGCHGLTIHVILYVPSRKDSRNAGRRPIAGNNISSLIQFQLPHE